MSIYFARGKHQCRDGVFGKRQNLKLFLTKCEGQINVNLIGKGFRKKILGKEFPGFFQIYKVLLLILIINLRIFSKDLSRDFFFDGQRIFND